MTAKRQYWPAWTSRCPLRGTMAGVWSAWCAGARCRRRSSTPRSCGFCDRSSVSAAWGNRSVTGRMLSRGRPGGRLLRGRRPGPGRGGGPRLRPGHRGGRLHAPRRRRVRARRASDRQGQGRRPPVADPGRARRGPDPDGSGSQFPDRRHPGGRVGDRHRILARAGAGHHDDLVPRDGRRNRPGEPALWRHQPFRQAAVRFPALGRPTALFRSRRRRDRLRPVSRLPADGPPGASAGLCLWLWPFLYHLCVGPGPGRARGDRWGRVLAGKALDGQVLDSETFSNYE